MTERTQFRDARVCAGIVGAIAGVLVCPAASAQEPLRTVGSVGEQIAPRGSSVAVGGGIAGFVDGTIRDNADSVGGTWDARLSYGTRSVIAVEVAYVGTAIGLDTLGLAEDAVLVAHGIEGDLRLNFETQAMMQPYLYAGLGYQRFTLANEGTNNSSFADNDDVVTVPLGAGLALRESGFIGDIRAGVRTTFHDDILAGTQDDAGLATWNLDIRVGLEF